MDLFLIERTPFNPSHVRHVIYTTDPIVLFLASVIIRNRPVVTGG